MLRSHLFRPKTLCLRSLSQYFQQKTFSELSSIHPGLQKTLLSLGLGPLTDIQHSCLQPLLDQKETNALILSETGSGKTMCYALPVMNRLLNEPGQHKTLVLAPTKELCAQIYKNLRSLDPRREVKICRTGSISYLAPIVHLITPDEKGSRKETPSGEEVQNMSLNNIVSMVNYRDMDILISTPAQLKQILMVKMKKGESLDVLPTQVVIDECDLLLGDTNLRKNLQYVLQTLEKMNKKKSRKVSMNYLMTGATLPKNIEGVEAVQYIGNWFRDLQTFRSASFHKLPAQMQHDVVMLDALLETNPDLTPEQVLVMQLEQHRGERTIVFCNSQEKCLELLDSLAKSGLACVAYHRGLNANQRMQVIQDLQDGTANIMVSTDLAARGLDFQAVSLVVQFEFALDGVSLIHRMGRTCRLGQKGRVISFLTESNLLLYEKFRETVQSEEHLDQIFSHKRSLSKNQKKSQRRS